MEKIKQIKFHVLEALLYKVLICNLASRQPITVQCWLLPTKYMFVLMPLMESLCMAYSNSGIGYRDICKTQQFKGQRVLVSDVSTFRSSLPVIVASSVQLCFSVTHLAVGNNEFYQVSHWHVLGKEFSLAGQGWLVVDLCW